ncbi:hypothetical protein ElyMa_002478000 [Elysia marginata]|uniref:Uncharacterized protein n=1 Tax=Elysia marginata TaxID=1093978 RepID=A0AAV4GNQ2_9GAST|nr:hypothetical protein ElyMa_002478000 [Elysia marginata]
MDVVDAVTLDGTEHVVGKHVAVIALVQTTLVINTMEFVKGAVIQDTRETTAVTNAALGDLVIGVQNFAAKTVLDEAIPVTISLEYVIAVLLESMGLFALKTVVSPVVERATNVIVSLGTALTAVILDIGDTSVNMNATKTVVGQTTLVKRTTERVIVVIVGFTEQSVLSTAIEIVVMNGHVTVTVGFAIPAFRVFTETSVHTTAAEIALGLINAVSAMVERAKKDAFRDT